MDDCIFSGYQIYFQVIPHFSIYFGVALDATAMYQAHVLFVPSSEP